MTTRNFKGTPVEPEEQLRLPFPRCPAGDKRNYVRRALSRIWKIPMMGEYDAWRAELDAAIAAEEALEAQVAHLNAEGGAMPMGAGA